MLIAVPAQMLNI